MVRRFWRLRSRSNLNGGVCPRPPISNYKSTVCGIFGIVTERPRAEILEAVKRATGALAHRGPDDEGIEFVSDERHGLNVCLAHRRLSILDLSPAGHQPMRDRETGSWITYNGEVFNFREIRRGLESRGLKFESDSDTEVLLKSYGRFGNESIAGWRGMFAFGLWDEGDRRLSLVRDRLGIKPLYYFQDERTFLFSSEIRALLSTGLVPRKLSEAALDSYLAFGSVQQPLTIIENVYAVLPGHWLSLKDWQIESAPYWQLQAGADSGALPDERAISEEIRELSLESVKLRLVSDVPVGVFLSGGIDSSAVVALIRRVTAGEIKSFSVCFKEQEFSEQSYAEQVARQYRTDHRSILLTEGEILSRLPAALRAMDQPSIDGINTYVVSESAARAGLKVAISGLGGDEVFAGYSFFRTIARDERLRAQVKHLPLRLRRAAAVAISTVAATHRADKLSALLAGGQLNEHSVRLHRQLFAGEQRRQLLGRQGLDYDDQSTLDQWTARQFANCAGADPINQASALDLGGYLSNTLLRDTDAMSMAHGLEVRVPLIDHRLVERALQIPGRIKLRQGHPKWLLVEAAGDLPREIVYRPKRGFELPFKNWLQRALRPEVEEIFRSDRLADLLDSDSVWSVWRSFLEGRTTWSRAWSLYVLEKWANLNL